MRVPEAYPLLLPYEATRPGLLVLDADGRRVDALALTEALAPAAVAKWLREGKGAAPRERFVLRVTPGPGDATVARFVEEASAYPGALGAAAAREGVVVLARPGAVSPDGLVRLGVEAGVAVECLEPVPVAFTAKGEADAAAAAKALAGVAGVWAVAEGKGTLRAWATRLLLQPAAIERASPGFASDLETRRYAIPGVSLGPHGMRVAGSLDGVPGVLSVLPELAAETVTVIGRRAAVAWPSVLAALKEAGIEAREKP